MKERLEQEKTCSDAEAWNAWLSETALGVIDLADNDLKDAARRIHSVKSKESRKPKDTAEEKGSDGDEEEEDDDDEDDD